MVLKYREPGTGQTSAWVARRADAVRALARGARVRIAIESAHEGYLYVVNREEYAGGRLGKPYLIFPTTRIREGDNAVRPGRVIEIPAPEDSPPFFILKSTGDESEYTGERLTVLVSQRRLEELKIGRAPLELPDQQVRQWEKQWRAATRRYSLPGGVGKPPTRAEQEAASLVERLVTHEDPAPQDYYVVSVKPGSPFLVEIPVRLAK